MYECPKCGANSRVKETRYVDGEVIRLRICLCNKLHHFYTRETVMDYVEGYDKLNKYWKGYRDGNKAGRDNEERK